MEEKTAQNAEYQAKRGVADLFHKDELKKLFIHGLISCALEKVSFLVGKPFIELRLLIRFRMLLFLKLN